MLLIIFYCVDANVDLATTWYITGGKIDFQMRRGAYLYTKVLIGARVYKS